MEIQINFIWGFSVGFEVVFVDPQDYKEFGAERILGIDLGIIRVTFFF